MNKKEIEKLQFTHEELMATFLAGSRMLSDNHTSWREAFEKWLKVLVENRSNALDLS